MDFPRARARHLRLGRRGEDAACRYLRDRGGEVLLRNYRSPAGEIDIIARDGLTLCFVEVKARHVRAAARPAAGLSRRQQRRIRRAALTYLREIGRPHLPWRFDLVEVVLGPWDIRELRHWPRHFSGRREERER
jgi:putative endonuclease